MLKFKIGYDLANGRDYSAYSLMRGNKLIRVWIDKKPNKLQILWAMMRSKRDE